MHHIREDSSGLEDLFQYIHKIRGIDFGLYRHATITRKLELRLAETGTYRYPVYLRYLQEHPEEFDNLIQALTVKVSNFFRNPLIFEILQALVLPELMARVNSPRIWSLGCANGEEPYSLALILHDLMRKQRSRNDTAILGTDICDGAIEKARKAEYPDDELLEVKKKYLDSSFVKVHERKNIYRLSSEITSMVSFECGDIISRLKSRKASGETFHIVLCRNLLIYLNRDLQVEIVRMISDILVENGYFVIGEAETIPDDLRHVFNPVSPGIKVYRKIRCSSRQS